MKGDVWRIISLQDDAHKIPGNIGSLNVTKVCWKICLTALKGHIQGREMNAAIFLEPVIDNYPWF